jgi:hypothetical protein
MLGAGVHLGEGRRDAGGQDAKENEEKAAHGGSVRFHAYHAAY